jgi:hypothetical protein
MLLPSLSSTAVTRCILIAINLPSPEDGRFGDHARPGVPTQVHQTRGAEKHDGARPNPFGPVHGQMIMVSRRFGDNHFGDSHFGDNHFGDRPFRRQAVSATHRDHFGDRPFR